ncbi:MAG TPA: GAF domain-containing protein [Ignavibacteriales bacterium]|nr:GAF domain-containing protein [Ignavibacteriales bacterium]
MSEELLINKDLSDKEKYEYLLGGVESLLSPDDMLISSLSNFTSILKQTFDKISWVGFYLNKNGVLQLGPFQGKLACTKIEVGRGVCGKSAQERKTVIVPDVNQFPGHIACETGARSAIVCPIVVDDKLFGVLDLDSHEYNSFNETDAFFLENLINILIKKLDLEHFQFN